MRRLVLLPLLLWCGLLAASAYAQAEGQAARGGAEEPAGAAGAAQRVEGARPLHGVPASVLRVRRRTATIGPGVRRRVLLYPVPVAVPPGASRLEGPAPDASEEALVRRLSRLDEQVRRLADAPGRPVLLLPGGAEALQALRDSLRLLRQELEAARPPGQPQPLPLGQAETTPEEVEAAILETGLFRAAGIHFAFDESTLLPEGRARLDAVGQVLQRYPALRIRVGGHTDAAGTAAYNLQLSVRRAAAVRAYLIDRFALDPDRIEAQGYGEAHPVADDDTPTGRTLNRRVEFQVLNPEAAVRYRRRAPEAEVPDPGAALREAIREELRRAQE